MDHFSSESSYNFAGEGEVHPLRNICVENVRPSYGNNTSFCWEFIGEYLWHTIFFWRLKCQNRNTILWRILLPKDKVAVVPNREIRYRLPKSHFCNWIYDRFGTSSIMGRLTLPSPIKCVTFFLESAGSCVAWNIFSFISTFLWLYIHNWRHASQYKCHVFFLKWALVPV